MLGSFALKLVKSDVEVIVLIFTCTNWSKLRSASVKLVLSLFEPISLSPLLADEKVEYKITASHKTRETMLDASSTCEDGEYGLTGLVVVAGLMVLMLVFTLDGPCKPLDDPGKIPDSGNILSIKKKKLLCSIRLFIILEF
ncbi:hypothetical protein BpHYR1_040205 [Brachionus plicatilis]|uniref:Uncharacterized protein n=1 Tax=Brachionus plicatilis TaxID=10195 RepID=A0A3M7PWR4_BRAPC|nr:hypothetical protein BpHYR1_040205 [Brachionus plicatilis]